MASGGLVLGSLILYLKGMRILMFQLSGYCFMGFLLTARDVGLDTLLLSVGIQGFEFGDYSL